MATGLYVRTIAYDYGDQERNDLMRKVWSVTPWMVDAFTGSMSPGRDDRYRNMADWCRAAFGPEAWPIHGKPGRWQRGGATVHGWTFFGFSTAEELATFETEWPTPPGITPPEPMPAA